MINLRKPTEAYIAPGSIQEEHLADGAVDLTSDKVIGELPKVKLADGAVDANKIEDGAVDLNTAKVVGELPESKLANNAVTEQKLADLAISTQKLKDNVVTLAKASDDVRLTPFIGGEVEQPVTGTTEVPIVETGMSRISGAFEPKKIRVIASLKVSSDSGNIGYLYIYADDEITPRLTLQTSETSYELLNGEFDISDLSPGRHKFTAKMKSSLVAGIVYNDYIEIYTIK